MSRPTFISLFSGIGGLDLGLERAGWRCVAQVEIDDYARRILTKHWPDVPKFGDVRSVGAHNLPPADLICGGFPCQDISNAGKRAGIDGERSGLWSEFARIIGELRPRYVLVENVSALLGRGIGRVLGDLAARGYDAEWQCIPAAAVGAPHRRDRLFIVAYASSLRMESERVSVQGRQCMADPNGSRATVAHPDPERRHGWTGQQRETGRVEPTNGSQVLADTDGTERRAQPQGRDVFNRNDSRREKATGRLSAFRQDTGWRQWSTEPAVGRVADGVPSRVDRLRGLGNAVVPQVAEFVGRCILEAA